MCLGDYYMRLISSKSKNAESFYLNLAFTDNNGKSTSRTYMKLGTLKELSEKLNTDRDGVVAWCKEQCRIETMKYKEALEVVQVQFSPSKIIDKDESRLFNCGYLFLQSLTTNLRLNNICRNIKRRHKYEFNLEAILSDLIYSRILDPSSKFSTYEFSKTLLEPPKYELHDVYRALSILAEENDYIQSEVYKNSEFIHHRKKRILYYDCTNYFFEIEEEDGIKKYGKSKEHRPNPIVTMGLFMDEDGIPLTFDIYPGNQNEQKTLKPLEKKVITDFDCAEFVYCSDSGLGSKDNKQFNTLGGRSYVITQSLKKLKAEDRNIALDTKQYRQIGSEKFIDLATLDETNKEVIDTVYYKEIPLNSDIKDEMMIVTYSVKYKNYQRAIRNGQIERAQNMIDCGKSKGNKKNPNDPARFVTKVHYTDDGEAASKTSLSLNQDQIDKEEMFDGFYAVVTNMDEDVQDIININTRRWKIEECFRIMKTEFSARPVYLQREDRIKAHFLICFLSLLVYRLLEIKLEKKYTGENIIKTIRNMKVTALEGYGYIPSYTRTDLTDSLHDVFGFRTDHEIIKKAKMRLIIKETKTLL